MGAPARRTGLTVKTVRYYSDTGLVPSTDRTSAGYRRYGAEAVARLELVRTLRELGIGLEAARRALEREASLAAVARAHADAPDLRIRTLRQRRAVLRAVAERGTDPGTPAAATAPAALTARYAEVSGRPDDAALRGWILRRLEVAAGPRVERYRPLLARINGRPAPPGPAPVFGWFTAALRAAG
ncbi:MerR family transcriptional regulator [Kitasatospora cineracea]|uniref:MerR family transcriptional regulator n=1 Tax=Kitasatospora cineracea TaxID=88074 RepID=UPI0036D8C26A